MDRNWWHVYGGDIRTDAELWTSSHDAARIYDLNYAPAPDESTHGGNSGYQAVRLAIDFGCDPIILLGYDMQFQGRRRHWHADHDETKRVGNPTPDGLKRWRWRMKMLGERTSARIVNASRSSALKCFPVVTLEDALCGRG